MRVDLDQAAGDRRRHDGRLGGWRAPVDARRACRRRSAQAHQLGVKVAGHCHGGIGVKEAVRVGLDTVEHGTMLDEEAVD